MSARSVVVGARLHLGLEAADDRHDRLQRLELPALARVQELVEEAHTAINATGGPIVPGPGRRTIPRHVLRPRRRGAVTGGTHAAGCVGPVGDRADGRRDRRDRVAARHHARRGAGRSDRRRRRAALPGARGGGRRARARRTPHAGDAAWIVAGLIGIYLFAAATLVLSGSSFPPIGIALDQGFRTASITKYAHSVALVDFAYKGLPPYYPPLFFWLLGRLAALTDTNAYEALKVGLLLSALVIPLSAVRFWSVITRDWAIAVAVAVAGLAFTDWYEPYGWLAVIVFVPWFLLFVLQVGRRDDLSRGMTVAGMAIGAAIVMTYYYPFFIGALALIGLLAARPIAARHGIALGPKFPRRTGIVLLGTVVISAVYWLPLLIAVVTTPGAQGYQNRYLDPTTVDVPLPFLTFDLVGFVLLFGLGYLVLSARRSPASMGLLACSSGRTRGSRSATWASSSTSPCSPARRCR